jgi:hypothetical protein
MKVFEVKEGRYDLVESMKGLQVVATISSLKYNNSKDFKDTDGRDRKRYYAEIKYVFLSYSRSSPYRGYDDDNRKKKAIIECSMPNSWKESNEIKSLISLVEELEINTDTKRTLRATKKMLDSLTKYIETVDFNAETEDGKPKYDPNKYLSIVEKLSPALDKIKELEEKADAEDNFESVRIKGGAKKGRREDHRTLRENSEI